MIIRPQPSLLPPMTRLSTIPFARERDGHV